MLWIFLLETKKASTIIISLNQFGSNHHHHHHLQWMIVKNLSNRIGIWSGMLMNFILSFIIFKPNQPTSGKQRKNLSNHNHPEEFCVDQLTEILTDFLKKNIKSEKKDGIEMEINFFIFQKAKKKFNFYNISTKNK